MEVLLYGPSYSYQGVIFGYPGWSKILNCMILWGVDYISMICMMGMNVIYCSSEGGNLMHLVCGWSVMWPVWCDMVGSAAVALAYWTRSPWAASIASVPIPSLPSGAASVQVMMTGAVMSAIPTLWSGPISPISIFLVVSRAWPDVAVFVCLVMLCWCAWILYFVRAVHDYMSIFFMFMASDVRAVSCNVSWFLVLKTSVILIWHHVDHWWWKDGCGMLLCCIEFLYLGNGIL